jgi:arylsulfatase A-like enzyme
VSGGAAGRGRPNILFINVDQQRYDCLGFTTGRVATPTLDALAAESVTFTSAFSPVPVCAPARQALLSGALPGTAAGGQQGLWNYDSGIPAGCLAPAPHHWPARLADAGYRMEWVGKWHASPTQGPAAWGYERHTPPARLPREAVRRLHEGGDPGASGPVGCYADLPLEEAPTHRLAAAAGAALERLAAAGGPWHLMVEFPEPHLPCLPCEPFARRYDPASIPPWPNFDEAFDGKPVIQRRQLESWGIAGWGWREWAIYLAGYFGIVAQVDDAIGRILATLDRLGQRRDTVVVYTTDHGDAAGSHRMMDKHYTMYEELVHVPLLVSWPGRIGGARACDDFVSHYLDLGPTLLELAGLDGGAGQAGQGQSLVTALQGRPLANPRESVFATYSGQQFGLYSQRMIRDRRYKYVWNATDVDELYDIAADPAELRNLAADPACRGLVARLRLRLYATFAALGDGLVTNRWMRRQLTGS